MEPFERKRPVFIRNPSEALIALSSTAFLPRDRASPKSCGPGSTRSEPRPELSTEGIDVEMSTDTRGFRCDFSSPPYPRASDGAPVEVIGARNIDATEAIYLTPEALFDQREEVVDVEWLESHPGQPGLREQPAPEVL